jgi:hypothetical protein
VYGRCVIPLRISQEPRCYELCIKLTSARPSFVCTITPACVLYAAVLAPSLLCWCFRALPVYQFMSYMGSERRLSHCCATAFTSVRVTTLAKRATCRHADCLTAGLRCDMYHQGQRGFVRRSEAGGAAEVPRIEPRGNPDAHDGVGPDDRARQGYLQSSRAARQVGLNCRKCSNTWLVAIVNGR